jgi:hypothetical protein
VDSTTPTTNQPTVSEQIERDLAALAEIAARAERLTADLQRIGFDARPGAVREAVQVAVSHLYFYGVGHGPKGAAAMQKIVALLAPEIGKVLVDDSARAAYQVVCPDECED